LNPIREAGQKNQTRFLGRAIGKNQVFDLGSLSSFFQSERLLRARRERLNWMSAGWFQFRLRETRITCHVSPLTGSAMAPAMQPLE
jgi:hypothetical protein